MYEDGNVTYKVGINWKDIIIKIVLLALFIILLLILFPKPDLDVFYDSIYTNNINTMKNAAEKYYTKDRLPATVGDSTSMTLKEMIDNKMIIRFTDKDKNYCDESSSKVQVTKTADSEYVLKVELNCGEQRDYILETLGDNGLCSGSTCSSSTNSKDSVATNTNSSSNKNVNSSVDDDEDYSQYSDVKSADLGIKKTTVTYYQHKKAIYSTKTVYTCPEGYTKNGTKCIKSTTGATIDATPSYGADETIIKDAKYNNSGTIYADPIKSEADTTYTCPEGYTKNGAYCIKYTDAIEKNGDTTYTCPEGYTKNGTKCVKSYTATYKEGATSYTCPNGGKLDGKNCVITSEATSNPSYTCPAGYTKNGSSCYKVYDATASTSYTCPAGYTKNGSKCTKSTSSSYNASVSKTYSCPNGGTLSGSKCVKSTSSSYNATPKNHYSCPNGGSLSGSKCVKTSSTSYNASVTVAYGGWVARGTQYYTSASKAYTGSTSKLVYGGAVSGATCGSPCGNKGIWYRYTYYTRSSYNKYSCPNGGSLSGSKCYKSTTSSYNASVSKTYSCPNGGSLSGSKCVKTGSTSYNATPKNHYSCPNGGTLSGTKCVKTSTSTINATPNTTYSCPNGGTLNGSKCTITTNPSSTPSYSCPSGYTLSGKECKKTYEATVSNGSGAYTCPDGGTLSDKTCTITKDATGTPGEKGYTCPEGYTLNSSTKKCEKKIDANKNVNYTYTCPEGYTKSGEGENTKCSKESSNIYYCEDANATLNGDKCTIIKKGEIIGYTCPEGYTKSDNKCIKQTTETIDANIDKQTTVSYKYTWSKQSYLEGWTFTGKTKVVSENYTAGQK